mgnify:CR=1 FL=1
MRRNRPSGGASFNQAGTRKNFSPTENGQPTSVRDANNNRSEYVYDGFDRLSRLTFPSATLGANAVNAADFESYSYDANGNRTGLRLRSGESIAFAYVMAVTAMAFSATAALTIIRIVDKSD